MTAPHDLIVRNGVVVTPGGSVQLDVAVREGRISALLEPGTAADAADELDATGLHIIPGGVDTHTHIAWPYDGTTTVDDWYTATRAAALGGTTTVIDFVPPDETVTLPERCGARVEEADADAVVDFGFHPILTPRDARAPENIGKVIADGFTSFKMYTTYEDRRVDDGAAWKLMRIISDYGGLPGFHAENHEILEAALRDQVESRHLTVEDYPESRPGLAEAEAIQMVSLYASRLGTPVYIFHVSGSEALSAVRVARRQGVRVFAETCTHYLCLDDTVFRGDDAWRYVISPPIRKTADRDDLWSAVLDGTVVSVGSDHCAYAESAKRAWPQDHRLIPAGAPGIEARTPMLWTEAARRGLSHAEFVAVSTERAARTLGLYPRKGRVQVGADADLVLWDAERAWDASMFLSASPETFSLYRGRSGVGLPRHVLVRGELVVRDATFVGRRGSGRFLRRDTQHA